MLPLRPGRAALALGLRARLILAFLAVAFLTGLSGGAGLYLVRRSGDQVAYLTGVVTPLRAESNRLIGTVQALRRALLGAVARLPEQEAGPAHDARLAAFREELRTADQAGQRSLGRLRDLAARAGVALPLGMVAEALQRQTRLMEALIEDERQGRLAAEASGARHAEFHAARHRLVEILQRVATDAEVRMTMAEEAGKTAVQDESATVGFMAALFSDTLSRVYPRLLGADRLIRLLVSVEEAVQTHLAQQGFASLDGIEGEVNGLLRNCYVQLRRLAGRLGGGGEGEQATAVFQELRATLVGPESAFAQHREALNRDASFNTGLIALRDVEASLIEELAVVDRTAHALEESVADEVRRSARDARLGLAAVAVLGTLCAVALGMLFASRLTRPLMRLRDAVAALAEGRPVDDLPGLMRQGEIGAVAASVLERTAHLATHDALTGLPNRALFRDRLVQNLAAAERDGSSVAVLYLDLDRFKEVNDTLGHAAGDRLLTQVAARIGATLRESDTLARLGGDEFAIIQRGISQPTDAEALTARLVAALSEPFDLDGHQALIGVSIGVSIRTGAEAAIEPGVLLQEADMALYRAKEEGRGTFRFFQAEMNLRLQERKALEADLRRALADGELHLHYQPQVSLDGQEIVGAEALLRWHHPERGNIRPDQFIPLAEETGLICPIGEWALRSACRQAVAWPGLKRMAVNVSPVQFRQAGFVRTVESALRDTGMEPARLELEITEGVLLHDTEEMLQILEHLRELGVSIAMDDFGTGYSSLGYLRKFRFDKIKIDRSFIRGLGEDADAAAIVRAVLGMSRALGIRANAEGVEEEDQLSMLDGEGCHEVQGYLFGRPMTPAAFEVMLGASVLPAAFVATDHERRGSAGH